MPDARSHSLQFCRCRCLWFSLLSIALSGAAQAGDGALQHAARSQQKRLVIARQRRVLRGAVPICSATALAQARAPQRARYALRAKTRRARDAANIADCRRRLSSSRQPFDARRHAFIFQLSILPIATIAA
jgi:hypothetical protein